MFLHQINNRLIFGKRERIKMQVSWKFKEEIRGIGHGVEFEMVGLENEATLGFIEGYEWKEHDTKVIIYLDLRLRDMPYSVTTELRLAILLFLTDKKRQRNEVVIHGFRIHYNA
jgi:hypothetical protein